MSIEEQGLIGLGGGITGALLTIIGVRNRLDTQDANIAEIKKTYQSISTCEATRAGLDREFLSIRDHFKNVEDSLKILLERSSR